MKTGEMKSLKKEAVMGNPFSNPRRKSMLRTVVIAMLLLALAVVIFVLFKPVNKPPKVYIAGPVDGSSFAEGDTVRFSGSGTDPEDGELSGSSLIWNSDKSGKIGTGTSFERADLPIGLHRIVLVATDRKGLSDTAAISITVTSAGKPVISVPPALNFGDVEIGSSGDASFGFQIRGMRFCVWKASPR
jgi:hypothetical protein